MTRALAFAALAMSLSGCRSLAGSLADPPGTVYAHFLDQSYIHKPHIPDRLKYEGLLNPHIALAQSIREANMAVARGEQPAWHKATSLVFTPAFVIRQLDDSSAAVRTPSFNPRAQFQVLWVRKTLNAGVSGRQARNPANWKYVDAPVLDFTFAHYSNGQAGCFYQGQQFRRPSADADFECVWPGAVPAAPMINQSDGSFSTWYVRGGGGYQRMWVHPGRAGTPITWRTGALLTYQFHLPFMTEDPQEPLFGDHRWRLQLEVEKHGFHHRLAGSTRLSFTGERANAAVQFPRNRGIAELSHSFTRLYGLGLFVRAHGGQDYYNISFTNKLDLVQWGLFVDLDRPDRFAP